MSEASLPLRDLVVETLGEVKGLRDDVGELRLEVRTTTASDADCLKRASDLKATHDKGITRAWEEGIDPLRERVAKLERGAWLRSGVVKLLLPVATGAVLTLLTLYLKGCVG